MSELIIDGGSFTNVACMTLLTSYKFPPRCTPLLTLINGSSKGARQPFLNKRLSLFLLVLVVMRSFVMFFLWMLVI